MPPLSPARSPLASPREDVPRRPHDTVLYGSVRDHLATFVAHTERNYSAPLPKYVVDTFDKYLACGDVAGGFLRCHCEGCGHDVLVAFSWTHRGLCPRCGARRMGNEAAQLAFRVFPNVPVRQWEMKVHATITEPSTVQRILNPLGGRAAPLPRVPARDRTWEQVDLGFDDAA